MIGVHRGPCIESDNAAPRMEEHDTQRCTMRELESGMSQFLVQEC